MWIGENLLSFEWIGANVLNISYFDCMCVSDFGWMWANRMDSMKLYSKWIPSFSVFNSIHFNSQFQLTSIQFNSNSILSIQCFQFNSLQFKFNSLNSVFSIQFNSTLSNNITVWSIEIVAFTMHCKKTEIQITQMTTNTDHLLIKLKKSRYMMKMCT